MTESLESKRCRRCDDVKPVTEFHRASANPDGLHSYCKPCHAAYKRERKDLPVKHRTTDTANGVKACTRCGETKPLDAFRKVSHGWHSWCLACAQGYDKVRYTKNQQDPAHRARAAEKSKRWYEANKARALHTQRERNYLLKYGLTIEGYDKLIERQGGCAICHRPANVSKKLLAVDHDHATGEVRGVLCDPCNRAIGLLDDDTERLSAAIEYLKNPPAQRLE